ncbi:hypothetical protein KZ483_24210 [Paenibacillus sp. sptzw28]|uniref:hypothetical protein n=1 Tax=Paenibacillus sp. sptzw28 TaxID=715179 RepID=UPI001C6E5BF8|nr:hypothetical protein [Paenibacillus sp. sptzw28]QYR20825.1 hypothetical protein KZ483_24210 [Paenibacillus sp. sptzw28]
MPIRIRNFRDEENKFTIHPSEELTPKVAAFLRSKDFCRITSEDPRRVSFASGATHSFEPFSETWSGEIVGHIVDTTVSLQDMAELLSKELSVPFRVILDGES